jgi:hypothetical protein
LNSKSRNWLSLGSFSGRPPFSADLENSGTQNFAIHNSEFEAPQQQEQVLGLDVRLLSATSLTVSKP